MDLRILVVDDSDVTRKMVRTVLETRNWIVCGEAEDGYAGVSQYRTLHPDVVILDLAMPGMSGLETARCMSRLDCSVPLILFTLVDELYLKNIARTAGISATVSKDHVLGLLEVIDAITAAKAAMRHSTGRQSSIPSALTFPAQRTQKFN
jgi:two-component system, chemotaxis family, chemotaxis protein CheY